MGADLGVSPSGALMSRAATLIGELTTGSDSVLFVVAAVPLTPSALLFDTLLAAGIGLASFLNDGVAGFVLIRLCSSSRILSISIDFFFEPLQTFTPQDQFLTSLFIFFEW
jgi:hypothetical protein